MRAAEGRRHAARGTQRAAEGRRYMVRAPQRCRERDAEGQRRKLIIYVTNTTIFTVTIISVNPGRVFVAIYLGRWMIDELALPTRQRCDESLEH